MREDGCSVGGQRHVTSERHIPEPMRPISIRRLVTAGGGERGTTTGRRIADGSRTAPYCALGSAVIRRVEVPPALGGGALYPKAGVMPRRPEREEGMERP